jgi:2-dehydro-3-deoxyphosphogluconate aldolase/(4S)-4-hydroxy-2-oxoglutarate aldolase
MSIASTVNRIKSCGIIAIIRGDFTVDDTLRIADALLAGGVTAMEVTLNSPSALQCLAQLRSMFGNKMLVGAGTVRNVYQAQASHDAGAQFLISPYFDSESASFAETSSLLYLPGVFTPTEAQTAFKAGCKILKLFPMDTVGPAHLRAIRAPLNDIEFVPTGGVSLENIGEYARAGAFAVGLGSKLVLNKEQPSAGLTARAKSLREAWELAKYG